MACRHLGIITSRVLYWHRRLAPAVRGHYDVEDMVSEVVCHVVSRSHYHEAGRGRESTFVWWMAENKCKWIVGHWQKKMRDERIAVENEDGTRGYEQVSVQMTDIVANRIALPDALVERCESFDALERMVARAGDAVLDLLGALMSGRVPRAVPDHVMRDFLSDARSCGVTIDDLRRALCETA